MWRASFLVTLPSAIALFSIFCTRAWPFSSRAASLWVSAPDFSPCSMRRSWFCWRWSMRGVLCVCASTGSASAPSAASVIIFTNFILFSSVVGLLLRITRATHCGGRRPCNLVLRARLREAGTDHPQRVGDQAIHAPLQQSPSGDRFVHRPAQQRVAGVANRLGLFFSQLLVIAMNRDATQPPDGALPIRRQLVRQKAARQIGRCCLRGFERSDRERREHRGQLGAAPQLARGARDRLAGGAIAASRRLDLDVGPEPEAAAERRRLLKARDDFAVPRVELLQI